MKKEKHYFCDNCKMYLDENDLDNTYPDTCIHCGEEALIEVNIDNKKDRI